MLLARMGVSLREALMEVGLFSMPHDGMDQLRCCTVSWGRAFSATLYVLRVVVRRELLEVSCWNAKLEA